MSAGTLAALAALVFFAGVVDALAGGGGLITLPAYLAAGLNPALLLGTNKLASSIGTVASAARYWRTLKLPLFPFLPVVAASLIGSLAGARVALFVDPKWIRPLLLVVLPVVGFLVHTHREPPPEPAGKPRREATPEALSVGASIGAYDGFIGPGTGTFFALSLTRFCGFGLLDATARAKVLNLASNVSALAAFLWADRVDLRLGLGMGAVSILGHTVGAQLGLKRGAAAIRPAILLVCSGLFVKLLLDLVK
ncbi:MAG: TSUP family transporter [Elusimicrobia bacterium]|nr:TSUP family transporter [Elusimicrobiota bacterium]